MSDFQVDAVQNGSHEHVFGYGDLTGDLGEQVDLLDVEETGSVDAEQEETGAGGHGDGGGLGAVESVPQVGDPGTVSAGKDGQNGTGRNGDFLDFGSLRNGDLSVGAFRNEAEEGVVVESDIQTGDLGLVGVLDGDEAFDRVAKVSRFDSGQKSVVCGQKCFQRGSQRSFGCGTSFH